MTTPCASTYANDDLDGDDWGRDGTDTGYCHSSLVWATVGRRARVNFARARAMFDHKKSLP